MFEELILGLDKHLKNLTFYHTTLLIYGYIYFRITNGWFFLFMLIFSVIISFSFIGIRQVILAKTKGKRNTAFLKGIKQHLFTKDNKLPISSILQLSVVYLALFNLIVSFIVGSYFSLKFFDVWITILTLIAMGTLIHQFVWMVGGMGKIRWICKKITKMIS